VPPDAAQALYDNNTLEINALEINALKTLAFLLPA
jgi:hypothetical protein